MSKTISPASNESAAARRAGILLPVLVVSFATLVPGGPVETRDFSHLGGPVFWGFNVFLVSLGLVAVVSAVLMLRGSVSAAWPAVASGWAYIFVVLLDLGRVFPLSPDAMPLSLGLIEILDAILAGYIIVLGHRALGHV